MQKTALITGATGQDASFLSELLLEKDYKVYGMKRRSSTDNTERLKQVLGHPNFELVDGDITDCTGIFNLVHTIRPDELYNLAAQSDVGISFKEPVATFEANAVGVLNLLEAIKQCSPHTKFYQASTSELFGNSMQTPQNENTPMVPCSPYATAKLAAHNLVRLYRQAYGVFACAGILFNHESEIRGSNFVTRKITQYVAKVFTATVGMENKNDAIQDAIMDIGPLRMGNLDARRDWGYAGDYVDAMYRMLQLDKPDDFVIATGKTHTVQEFINCAFAVIGLSPELFVMQDPKFMRPADVHLLVGDASKAKRVLGWEPTVAFPELVEKMVISDLKYLGIDTQYHK